MSRIETMSDEQFERHPLEVLGRELGANGLARFLRLYRSGRGDYTKDRTQWQKELTIQEVLESIKHRRQVCQSQIVSTEGFTPASCAKTVSKPHLFGVSGVAN